MRRFVALVFAIIALAAVAGVSVFTDVRRFGSRPMSIPSGGLDFEVERGTSLQKLADDLDALGLLDRPPVYFSALARMEGVAARIQAGEYRIAPGSTPWGLLELLASGRVIQHSLTVIEGWTVGELLDAVRAHPKLQITIAENLPFDDLMVKLGAPGVHPEGQFLPDTYHFPKGTTDVDFLRRARNALQTVLANEWRERDEGLPLESPTEALILASIIEKETGVASERSEIAGVFVRRLRRGMLLQTDPTVIYGLGPSFDGNIRRADLSRDTPYNTYKRKGLPPTPIALPGRDAIHAALHPADGNTLYFVAKGDGSHHFSATLEEHNRAVRQYQLNQ